MGGEVEAERGGGEIVRPLPLEKLLNMLGYDYSAPVEGRREAVDKTAIKALLKPKTELKKVDPATSATPDEQPK